MLMYKVDNHVHNTQDEDKLEILNNLIKKKLSWIEASDIIKKMKTSKSQQLPQSQQFKV